MKTLPTDYELKLTLAELEDSFMFQIAKAVISEKGFYTCTYKGLKTLITN